MVSTTCVEGGPRGGELGEGSVLTEGGYPHYRPTSKVPARRLPASRYGHVRRTGMVQSESRVDGAPCESSSCLGRGPDPISRKAHDLSGLPKESGFCWPRHLTRPRTAHYDL
jgi:hypothetical protein